MSLGHLKPNAPSAERMPLALVRDPASAPRDSADLPQASGPVGGCTDGSAGDLLARWKRLCDRLESVPSEGEFAEQLACWLRIGAEPFGASGGMIEAGLGAGAGDMLRVSFGLDERTARALASIAVGGGVLPIPEKTELVVDLAQSDTYGGLLVRPFLETDGILAVLSAPLRARNGIVGVLRYFFAQQPMPAPPLHMLAEMFAQRLVGLIEFRLAVRRAQTAEARLHAVLDGAGAAIVTVSADGRVLETNDATAVIFGYPCGELRGMPLSSLFPSEAERLLAVQRTGVREEPRALEFEAQRRDGSAFVAEVVVGSGALQAGRTLVIRDATARRSADAQMRQCERLAAIGTLAAGLGHDLNNTLLPMRAHLSAILPPPSRRSGSRRDLHAREIRAGLAHLQELADAVHFLATDTDTCTIATTDLATWWRHAGPLLEKALHEVAVLEVRIDADLPPVRIDERSLSRAVLSLLVNAGEAMPRERPRELARVLLRAGATDGGAGAFIEVSDNGIGMTDEVRRRAFDPYFTTKIRAIGSGLGLPIARGIVERAAGRIEVETLPGIGTTMRIRLRTDDSRSGHSSSPRVACTVADGRIASMLSSVLASHGVTELTQDPQQADIWIVSGDELVDGVAQRWHASRPGGRLIVLDSPGAGRSVASWGCDALVVSDPRDFLSISAAVRQALVNAGNFDHQRGAHHG